MIRERGGLCSTIVVIAQRAERFCNAPIARACSWCCDVRARLGPASTYHHLGMLPDAAMNTRTAAVDHLRRCEQRYGGDIHLWFDIAVHFLRFWDGTYSRSSVYVPSVTIRLYRSTYSSSLYACLARSRGWRHELIAMITICLFFNSDAVCTG